MQTALLESELFGARMLWGGDGVQTTHHVVGPGDEVGSPLDVGDGALAFMNH